MAYTFDPIFAADPSSPATVATNAAVTIFDPADSTKAPITITDVTGAPLLNPLVVNERGFGPAFQHATLSRVGWFGGGFTGYLTSYEGLQDATLAAQKAAQDAAKSAADAAALVGTPSADAIAAVIDPQKGAPSGLATLDSDGTLDPAQVRQMALMDTGQDLDTYTLTGVWNAENADTVAGGSNFPTTAGGVLEVFASTTGATVLQRYTSHGDTASYKRELHEGGWTPWISAGGEIIQAGTATQYFRGDKTWQTLDKAAVDLANVDNTSDANKPVSAATATALAGKENSLPSDSTGKKFLRGDKTWQTVDNGMGSNFAPEFNADPSMGYAPPGTQLTIPTHVTPSGGQVTHPSALFFADAWNGYKYWMAITPYTSGNDAYEDPNLVVSNNGIDWIAAPGVTQPLDDQPGSATGAYNSDVDLKMGPDNTMYLFFRTYDATATGHEEKLYYFKSTDGVNWGNKVLILDRDKTLERLASPSFIFENGKWTMYAVDIVKDPAVIVRAISNGSTPESGWGSRQAISYSPALPSGRDVWHIFVLKTGGRYFALLSDRDAATGGSNGDLYLMRSDNGTSWDLGAQPVTPRVALNYNCTYRSTMVPAIKDGQVGFRLFYVGWNNSSPSVWNLYRTFISLSANWTNLSLQGTWTAYTGGGGYYAGLHIKRSGNSIIAEGAVKGGAASSIIANLPLGSRPAATQFFAVNTAGNLGMVQVKADTGDIVYFSGAATPSYMPINIRFEVR